MSLSPESSFAGPPTDASSNVASMAESTPPTTVADTASLHSDMSKHDVITVAVESMPSPSVDVEAEADTPPQSIPRRAQRARGGPKTYNLAKLSGTDGHGKRRANGDIVSNRRRRRTLGATTAAEVAKAAQDEPANLASETGTPVRDTIDALNLSWSPEPSASPSTRPQIRESPRVRRPTARLSESSTTGISPLGKKLSASATKATATKTAAKAVPKAVAKATPKPASKVTPKPSPKPAPRLSREMRRLQDTKEFAHIDEQPIIYTVWAKGKYVNPKEKAKAKAEASAAASNKVKVERPSEEQQAEDTPEPINARKRRVKKFLDKGLYAGQEAPRDRTKGFTTAEKKAVSQLPELEHTSRANRMMPAPMFNGLRTLIAGRDFKLPYQVCNPLPPGQPKPDEWKKMTKNRFIGESREIWRKSPHYHDMSKCVCAPEDGCGESCQNRIMLYECDETNCNVGRAHCTNRAFADLTTRRNKGGKYRVGVEVIKTPDRGHGVRSNRCFEPHQIIMEYAGEIITEEECERRMNEKYKDNECYYLMSFDQNMIIDATTGSIARFVNHSCNPNCRMIKWIVSGQPRMALFAGDKPIMTGDELTYDYNFDPFSAKNVQKCLCEEPNCRGVLGPKPREVKPAIKSIISNTVKAGKRKLQELIGDGEEAGSGQPKRKKAKPITSTKGALASVGIKVTKGAATVLKKGMSSIASSAKKVALGTQSATKQRIKTGAVLKKTTTTRVIKAYGKGPSKKPTTPGKAAKSVKALPFAKGKGSAASQANKLPTKKTTVKATVTKLAVKPAPTKKPKVLTKTAGVTKKTSPKKASSGWSAINSSPRKALDLDRGDAITVASAV